MNVEPKKVESLTRIAVPEVWPDPHLRIVEHALSVSEEDSVLSSVRLGFTGMPGDALVVHGGDDTNRRLPRAYSALTRTA